MSDVYFQKKWCSDIKPFEKLLGPLPECADISVTAAGSFLAVRRNWSGSVRSIKIEADGKRYWSVECDYLEYLVNSFTSNFWHFPPSIVTPTCNNEGWIRQGSVSPAKLKEAKEIILKK